MEYLHTGLKAKYTFTLSKQTFMIQCSLYLILWKVLFKNSCHSISPALISAFISTYEVNHFKYSVESQTCQRPRDKSLDILNLELRKVVRNGKKSLVRDVLNFLVEGLPAVIMGGRCHVSFL